ncbi:hypothetical protein [Clostridium sp. Cult1]|uniref:hypothetical protein n=1 Tax=Clostridium sp. Cult1 TaxID=2079002 RepID=UPI001F29C6F9|nr:hypothetical protein [Clostridium sp. Cult1]MCF6461901.1 hypothetical protein [Clostridium sp. Cult1]
MKRKLSLLLAVVMILGSFSFAFADDDFDVPAFLEKEGILKGNTKGDLMLDEPLLRKDAVVLLARLLKAEDEAEAFEKEGLPTFNDLAGNPYYNAFLAWAEDNGYFTGKPDGSFGYEDNLEAVEYALVLLRALGYVNEDKADEWEKAWDTAKELGLLEDVKAERREEILRKEVAQMTFNALGVTMKDSDKTLAEFLGITMPEPGELKVEKVYTENLKEIVVELSNAKLADKEKLEDVNNYRLTNYRVQKATVEGNKVILLLANTYDEDGNLIKEDHLIKGRKYDLVIRGIDKDVNGKYEFTASDNSIPVVEDVVVLGEYGIKVVTSEPVKRPLERNFLIDGKNVAMEVEQYGRNIILTPYYKVSFPENAETLTVKELVDFDGYRTVEKDFDIEIVKDEVAPEVVDVIAKGNKVEVIFDKDIYKDSVAEYYSRSSVGNISYESGRHNIYATDAKKVDTNRAVYTFKDELPRRTDVTIVDVMNHSKVEMEKTTMEARVILDYTEPEIIDTKVTTDPSGTATIKLYFDKDVTGSFKDDSTTEFVAKDHFALYVREVVRRNELDPEKDFTFESAKYDGDRRDVVVVELSGLKVNNRDRDYDYILEVVNFVDASSARNKMYRDYVDFDVKAAKSPFRVLKVTHKILSNGDAEVYIELNKAVDRERAETEFANYLFTIDGRKYDVKDLDGKVIVDRNGKRITLVIPEFDKDNTTTLEILETLKDKDGARLAEAVTYDFDKGLVTGLDVTGGSVKLEDGKYVVTPSASAGTLEIKTNFEVTIVINGNVAKAIVNAPNAHLEIDKDVIVDELVIEAISSQSVEIKGTVKKLVVATTSPVRVYGEVVGMEIVTTKNEAVVNVSKKATDKPLKVELEKGVEKVITEKDGELSEDLTEDQKDEQRKEEAFKNARMAIAAVKPVTELKDIPEAKNLVEAAYEAIETAKTEGVEEVEIKKVGNYGIYAETKALLEGIENEEGDVDYDAVLNTDHEDENIRDYYFIKVTVTGKLDKDSIEAIYAVNSEKYLDPDTDTVLWFRVAHKDDIETPLHEEGTYTYLVKDKHGKIYSFTHEFIFEHVNFPGADSE